MKTQELKIHFNILQELLGIMYIIYSNQKFHITNGVHYLRESCQAYWLLDVIYSYYQKLQKETFQVWILKLQENDNWIVNCTSGNYFIRIIGYLSDEGRQSKKEFYSF